MHLYARITKVDEQTGIVYGRAVQETPDRSNEIFDYESSKPNFQKWSEGLAKATDGKSVGNVRAMHGKIAAGKLTELNFNDAEKAIDVAAEIVDPVEREKCIKGVYTGFSIGGQYVGAKWDDPVHKGVKRYTANPTEISLVDLPCVPTAQFTVVKGDGATELRKFESTTDNSEALAKWFDGLSAEDHAELQKMVTERPLIDLISKRMDHAAVESAIQKIARRKDVDPKDGEDKYGDDADAGYADPKNKKYPLKDKGKWDFEKIKAAWSYIHMPKNAAKYDAADLKTIKGRIAAAWKAVKGELPPASEKKAEKLAKRAGAAELANAIWSLMGGQPMEKGLGAVSQFAQLLDALAMLAEGTERESAAEADGSNLPQTMWTALKPLAHAFLAMAEEETNEALHGQLNDDASMALAARTPMEKRGAKHSAATKEHFKAMREHHKAMGEHLDALEAKPDEDDDDDGAQKLAKAADGLQKMTAERDTLAKAVAERDEMLLKAVERIDQQGALIKKLEELPAPSKATIYAVSKAAEAVGKTETEVQPVLKADGTVDDAATAIRKALQNPVRTR